MPWVSAQLAKARATAFEGRAQG